MQTPSTVLLWLGRGGDIRARIALWGVPDSRVLVSRSSSNPYIHEFQASRAAISLALTIHNMGRDFSQRGSDA